MFLLPVSLPLTSILIAACLAVLQSRKAIRKLSDPGSLGLSEAKLAFKHNLQTHASYTDFPTAGLWERTPEAKNRSVTAYQEAYREKENMFCFAQQWYKSSNSQLYKTFWKHFIYILITENVPYGKASPSDAVDICLQLYFFLRFWEEHFFSQNSFPSWCADTMNIVLRAFLWSVARGISHNLNVKSSCRRPSYMFAQFEWINIFEALFKWSSFFLNQELVFKEGLEIKWSQNLEES